MSTRELLKGHSETIILSALADGAKHGYAISQHIKTETSNQFSFTPGMLYPLLHALENKKLIQAKWLESRSGPKRKVYSITTKGKRTLALQTLEWKNFSILINGLVH